MFQYEVLTEKEAVAERFQLVKEGEYDAVVVSSIDKRSASGNHMMDMTLAVYDEEGKIYEIRDFLVFSRNMMWKVIQFCQAANIMDKYESVTFCSKEAINRIVRVRISIEEGKEIPIEKLQGKPLGSKYPDKNKIDFYIKREQDLVNTEKKDYSSELMEDNIPF